MKIFPKLFVGDAAAAFRLQLKKSDLGYPVYDLATKEELISFIETFSGYKHYKQPVIVSDLSFFTKKDQSLFLKFMEDGGLNLVLLASRDNILNTIISRVKEYRKYYVSCTSGNINFLSPSRARELLSSNENNLSDSSTEDRLRVYNKYNPIINYDNELVKKFGSNNRNKLLNLIET